MTTSRELQAFYDWFTALPDNEPSYLETFEAGAAWQAAQSQPAAKAATVPDNSQDWAGMDGTIAHHLIERHADNWNDVGKMMDEWLAANQAPARLPLDEAILEAVKTFDQSLREMHHAYFNPEWFTGGKYGAAKQFILWHRKGNEAVQAIKSNIHPAA